MRWFAVLLTLQLAFVAQAGPPVGSGYMLRLLHTDEVLTELQCDAETRSSLDQLLQQTDPAFWQAIRSRAADQLRQLEPLEGQVAAQLAGVLSPTQLERLAELTRRAQGSPYLGTDDAAEQLTLTTAQRSTIQTALKGAQRQRSELGDQATPESLQKIEADLAKDLQQALRPEQQQQLVTLLGQPFDLMKITERGPLAPEIADIAAWYNGQPTTLAEHRGKVIALHFFAAGCINCVRNLPHYNRWAQQFPADQFVVLGIHTPETDEEKQLVYLEQKLKEYDIQYPVAHDGQSMTWNGWHNTMWPTVYLIDRQGRIRTWWEGELNWQGATGDRQFAERIEQLLNEPAPQVLTSQR